MPLSIRSPAFADQELIPARYTCQGKNVLPPLEWSGAPAGTRSLALIVDDPDAPDPAAPRVVWVHWLLYDLPPWSSGLGEGVGMSGLPAGAKAGINDFGRADYGGPCPPIGNHRYFFKLHALDALLGELRQPRKAALLEAMRGHVLEEATLVGRYQKR